MGAELGTDEVTATARSFTMCLDLEVNDLLPKEPMSLTRKSLTGREPKTVERKRRHDNRRRHPANMVREEALDVGDVREAQVLVMREAQVLVVGEVQVLVMKKKLWQMGREALVVGEASAVGEALVVVIGTLAEIEAEFDDNNLTFDYIKTLGNRLCLIRANSRER